MNPEREDAVERGAKLIFAAMEPDTAFEWTELPQTALDEYRAIARAVLDAARQSAGGAVPVSSADEREWTLMPGRGYTPTRTTVETATHIPVVPKSTLLAAQRRVEETESALKAMLARAGTERDGAMKAPTARLDAILIDRLEKAESERDALAGALRAIQAEWFEDGTLSNKIDAALAANPQASNEKKGT